MNTIERSAYAAKFASEKKAESIKVLDLQGVCTFTDAFVICTAQTSVQLRAIANSIKLGLKELGETNPIIEGDQNASWIVMDYGDVMVHLLDEEARDFYDLEGLWGDGKLVDWESYELPKATKQE